MGGDPVTVIEDIRDLLDIGRDRKNPREDYLGEWLTWDPAPSLLRAWTLTLSSPSDVYVFGVGPLVDPVNINALASKKNNEQHVFKVKDMEDLENVFYKMIDETKSLGLCGMVWEHQKGGDYYKQPWQAKISVTVSFPALGTWGGEMSTLAVILAVQEAEAG